jgi:class 3 adenylate cyclase
MGHAPVSVLDDARDALREHDWTTAFETLRDADQSGTLPAEGLRMLAEAAWWAGEPEVVLEAAERAHAAYLEEGDRAAAALAAFELGEQYAIRLAGPLSSGWFARAERLAADEPTAPVHARLAWLRGYVAVAMQGDVDASVAHFQEAQELARQTGDRNTEVRSLHDQGRVLCLQGRRDEGSRLMDEAMVAAVGGELDPLPTGIVYCSTIDVCSQIGDYQRAAEWTDATTRWCERLSISGFPGVCRVHRAEILRLRGAWTTAEAEAYRACDELPRFNLLDGVGYAFYEIGEVRRRMGDFAGAEEAFGRAHEHGRDPQPGLSLVRLAQGNLEAAAAGVRRMLSDDTLPRVGRVHPLAAQVEIALAAGDHEVAAGAAGELAEIAADIDTPALRAIAACARGAVHLADGDHAAAVPELRTALRMWRDIDAPYEAAEVRVLLGRAYAAGGDPEGAQLELRAARDAFERLGAAYAAERTAELLGRLTTAPQAPERVRRAFVFTDIVKSTDLVTAIGDEAWEDLLSWHDQTLRSLFASHGGEVAHHTGDGFFIAFADSDAALACAVRVQRALAEHRQAHGFAPLVRIGVHAAEATRRGQDYSGAEVHKAARLAALAEGGEILASDAALAEASGRYAAGASREVTLKGIAEPLQVAAVAWR